MPQYSGEKDFPRRDRRPVGYFSEEKQQQRNEEVRGPLEGTPQMPSKKRSAPDDSGKEAVPAKKRQRQAPKSKPLDVEALLKDLDTDYSKVKPAHPPKRPAKQNWTPTTVVITDRGKAPIGWNPEEPDLMDDDLPAQIVRCRERIKEKIMPQIYEYKLKGFLAQQEERTKAISAAKGLSWPVLQRLDELQSILRWLESDEIKDKYKLASNVKNIISAYRSGALDWCHGFVTYWNNGAQICQPRPFQWKEFQYLHDKHQGNETGFWIEGFNGPGPSDQLSAIQCGPGERRWGAYMKISLRIARTWVSEASMPLELEFKDDTGADYMTINDDDISAMRVDPTGTGGLHPLPRIMGVLSVTLADGSGRNMLVRELQANIWDADERRYMVPEWDSIPAVINPTTGAKRLNGPWLRWKLYTATCPDNSRRLWIYDYNPSNPPVQADPRIPTATQAQLNAPYPTATNYESIGNHPEFDTNLPSGVSVKQPKQSGGSKRKRKG
ncbi:hypothetical protein N7457_003132 [Penicillium paradoxum]|uniref:uncharacterized protein n=1 Tax=Penicillium paradoxum TaxID=176176 RepID=UPI002547DBD3|nr:uncharacterized protein N7457_003132 [Penicillium paradoxum]KAJ5788142.1 hypothetical protein N7457_003132 [Penicillium paradoxum]